MTTNACTLLGGLVFHGTDANPYPVVDSVATVVIIGLNVLMVVILFTLLVMHSLPVIARHMLKFATVCLGLFRSAGLLRSDSSVGKEVLSELAQNLELFELPELQDEHIVKQYARRATRSATMTENHRGMSSSVSMGHREVRSASASASVPLVDDTSNDQQRPAADATTSGGASHWSSLIGRVRADNPGAKDDSAPLQTFYRLEASRMWTSVFEGLDMMRNPAFRAPQQDEDGHGELIADSESSGGDCGAKSDGSHTGGLDDVLLADEAPTSDSIRSSMAVSISQSDLVLDMEEEEEETHKNDAEFTPPIGTGRSAPYPWTNARATALPPDTPTDDPPRDDEKANVDPKLG